MIKNWKTTILGAVVGGAVAIQPLISSGSFSAKDVILGFLIAAFGVVSKDFNVSGK